MTDEEIKFRINEIESEQEKLDVIFEQIEKGWDFGRPYEDYQKERKPFSQKYNELDAEKRQIMPYELSELYDFGDVMSLKHFIENVKDGGFINYDGFGNYVKDGKQSNIEVYPSDVRRNRIRTDFDTIIWFNR
jgi:hypothetical protein